jgi:class 3 adenylate cyclase/ribosomal protein L40E
MTCPRCQHENPGDAVFCQECGSRLEKACSGCGTANRLDAKFCKKCGQPVAVMPPAAKAVKLLHPVSSAPKHLAEKILASKSALEGERKLITVLFADVKGSMELAEQLGPEVWSQIMQRFFRILCASIERFEGFVDKFTGDGGMALFGAPIAHEDHAQRACYAALHLRDAARTYASEVRARHGVPFAVRIGLNSGEVVVGRIGEDLHMEFTAQGHVVGLAQRMEARAESGHICLSEHTARLVEGYFQLQDLGRIAVKGVSQPVRLFELEAVGAFQTRFDRSRARGLSAFVGRDREMAALDAALERARRPWSGGRRRRRGGHRQVAPVRRVRRELSRARDPDPRGTRSPAREGDSDAPHAGDVACLLRDRGWRRSRDDPREDRRPAAPDGRELP